MKWLLLLAGLLIACVGSAGAAALVTTARVAIGDAIARRLKGENESLDWLALTERQVVAATAATSFGVGLVGAAIPGMFSHLTVAGIVALLCFLVVPATLIGGYLLPRWLTATRAARVVELCHPILAGWSALLRPLLPSRESDPSEEIRALAREGSASGLGGDELVMVGGVMSFADRPVRGVMTPRTDTVAVPHDASYEHVMALFTESGYTRMPVYRATLDEVIGMVHAFDLFKQKPGEPLPLRPVTFAPATRSAGDVLIDMQRARQHFAVVVDEFGGTAGIVTLENLLEALVGEISDEDESPIDAAPALEHLLELDGGAPTSAVAEHFGVTLPAAETSSFGGLIAELAGRIPMAGDRFRLFDLDVDILQASPTKVERVLIRRGRTSRTRLDGAIR